MSGSTSCVWSAPVDDERIDGGGACTPTSGRDARADGRRARPRPRRGASTARGAHGRPLARAAGARRPRPATREALSRLVEEVQHPVYRLALRFLGHPEDAKDASQEILIRLITHLGSFEGRSQFMTWAYTIAVRQLMRTRKRQIEAAVKGAEAFAAASGPRPCRPRLHCRGGRSTGCCAPRSASAAPTGCCCACRGRCAPPTSSATRWACPTRSPPRSAASRAPPNASAWFARAKPCGTIIADRCGLVDAANPCRCGRQIQSSLAAGILDRDNLTFAEHPRTDSGADRDRHDRARGRATRPRPGDERGLPLGPQLRRTTRGLGTRQGRLPRPARVTWRPRWLSGRRVRPRAPCGPRGWRHGPPPRPRAGAGPAISASPRAPTRPPPASATSGRRG